MPRTCAMPQTYYDRLGLPRDSTLDEIRSAYRRLSLQYHPDANQGGSEQFLKIKEAYETLSDPERRREYDLRLAAAEQDGLPRTLSRPEPIYARFSRRSPSPFRDVTDVFSSTPIHSSASTHLPPIDLALTPEEAESGGHISLRVALPTPCDHCTGTGVADDGICRQCDGHGQFDDEFRVALHIPPRVRDGTLLPLPIGSFPNREFLMLRVHILR
ncbi:MAG: DnaJ domain-containing protein [Bacillota bacterium]